MAEVESILKRLTQQDRILEHLSQLIKGSSALNIEGVLPMLRTMKTTQEKIVSDVQHLQNWKAKELESKGTISIKTSILITRILAIIGALGVLVGAILGITQFIDWLHIQQSIGK